MNTIEVNKNTLAVLYEQCPLAFEGITLAENILKYNNETVDISKFNINDLLDHSNNFASSLDNLSPQDVFNIIKLHANLLGNADTVSNSSKNDKNESNKKIEKIQQENPLMRNISVVYKNDDGIKREYINLVDSNGKDFLFPNDRNVNIFDIYEFLKLKYGNNVKPDQLIEIVYRKLYDVKLDNAENLIDKNSTSEDFVNKLEHVNEPYKDSKTTQVIASEEHDIAIIADKTNSSNHKVVTFDQNEFGDLIVNQHVQNVIDDEKILDTTNSSVKTNDNKDQTIESDIKILDNDDEEIAAILITTQEFYDLINSSEMLSEEQKDSVNLYYSYLGELIIYEDYLVPELRKMLQDFRNYVYELEYGDVHIPLNEKQREAIKKAEEMSQIHELNQENFETEKINSGIKKLQLIKPVDNYNQSNNDDNLGMISTMQVIAFIIGIAIILTAITLYLLS